MISLRFSPYLLCRIKMIFLPEIPRLMPKKLYIPDLMCADKTIFTDQVEIMYAASSVSK